jgi:hypothetical protein
VSDVHGRVDAYSKAFPGSWHDKHCFDEADLAGILAGCGGLFVDCRYQGVDGVTPIKDRSDRQLTEDEHRFNNGSIDSLCCGAGDRADQIGES